MVEAASQINVVCGRLDDHILGLCEKTTDPKIIKGQAYKADLVAEGRELFKEYTQGCPSLAEYLIFSFDKIPLLLWPEIVFGGKGSFGVWLSRLGFDLDRQKYGVFDADGAKRYEIKTLLNLPLAIQYFGGRIINQEVTQQLADRFKIWKKDFEDYYKEPFSCPDNIVYISSNTKELEMYGFQVALASWGLTIDGNV